MADSNKLKSREAFVQQVASTIQREHETRPGESFVFGISGKWGEGKTYFLRDLEKALADEADIVWLNPWKHGSDRAAFMRSLVREVAGKRGTRGRLRDLWLVLQGRPTRAEKLESDSSRQRVNLVALVSVLFILVLIYASYKLLVPLELKAEMNEWRTLFLLLGIPIVLAAVGSSLVGQAVSRSVATTDGFSSLLESLLADRDMKHSKRIVVFVDDLDRVSAQMARDVLDSLRTFFDQPALSFVVAGDHTVLERILGRELLPERTIPEQLDEGRRFLKKVFNVYWRLPLPVAHEFEALLAGLLQDRRESLAGYLNDDELKRLNELLSKYFEKNLRAVSRFVDEFIFTMQAVDVRLMEDDDAGLADLKTNPLLVVRILMMQENCSPFFEAVLRDPRVLDVIEVGVDRQESEPLEQWITANAGMIAERQERFLRLFIYETPRFFQNSVLTVSGLEPFLYLTADASEDNRGVAPEDFARLAAMGNTPEVTRVLSVSGDKRLAAASRALESQFGAGLEEDELLKQLVVVVRALQGLPPHHPAHALFSPLVLSQQVVKTMGAKSEEHFTETFDAWREWLDGEPAGVDIEDYVPVFPYMGKRSVDRFVEELDSESDSDRLGRFGSRVLLTWILALYAENHESGANALHHLTDGLRADTLKAAVEEIESALIDDLVDEQFNPDTKSSILNLLVSNTDGGEQAKTAVLRAVQSMQQVTWKWASMIAGSASSPWTSGDIESVIVNTVVTRDSPESLLEALRFASNKLSTHTETMWKLLVDERLEVLLKALPALAEDQSFASLTPSDSQAMKLFAILKNDVKRHEDPGARASAIRLMRKGIWLWDKLTSKPDRTGISGLRGYRRDPRVEAAVSEVLGSWNS